MSHFIVYRSKLRFSVTVLNNGNNTMVMFREGHTGRKTTHKSGNSEVQLVCW